MSIDYFIFLQTAGPIQEKLKLLESVDGVSINSDGVLQIPELQGVTVNQYDERGQMIMREEHGIDINWCITGSLVRDYDSDNMLLVLCQCVAAIVNGYPNETCALMGTALHFLIRNTSDELVLFKPIYMEARLVSLFQKTFTFANPY